MFGFTTIFSFLSQRLKQTCEPCLGKAWRGPPNTYCTLLHHVCIKRKNSDSTWKRLLDATGNVLMSFNVIRGGKVKLLDLSSPKAWGDGSNKRSYAGWKLLYSQRVLMLSDLLWLVRMQSRMSLGHWRTSKSRSPRIVWHPQNPTRINEKCPWEDRLVGM